MIEEQTTMKEQNSQPSQRPTNTAAMQSDQLKRRDELQSEIDRLRSELVQTKELLGEVLDVPETKVKKKRRY